MKAILKYSHSLLCIAVLAFTSACGNVKTGDEPGETNRENPKVENRDQTGDGYTHEYNDATQDAEVGPSPGADTTNTDSVAVTPRMGR